MRFIVTRASQGSVSSDRPCRGAVQGPESAAWPGEYQWFIDLNTLEELTAFLERNGGALGLYTPEEGPRPKIRVWMRTAKHGRVVAHRTFVRTLVHELCHHLDYTLLELEESFHTEGFFKRESSLCRQLLPPRERRGAGAAEE